jgi:hypothetical protein
MKSLTVKEFTDLKLDKKIKLSESFQRGTDLVSSWNNDNKKDYIHSTLAGTATNPIHLVDIKKALKYNEGADPESYEIFKKYDEEGYIYLSIDGNNRSIALKDFREDSFKMYQREYPTDRLLVEVKKDYDTYSTMGSVLKEIFDYARVNLIVYSNVTIKQCSELFRDVNRGKTLNHQQFRQSYLCPTADWVRATRKKYYKSLNNFITDGDMREFDGDEFIVKMMSFAHFGECDKGKYDRMYFDSNTGHVEKLRLFTKNESNFKSVLHNFFTDISVGTNKLSPNAVFDYFILLWNYKLDNIKVDNHKDFYKLWLDSYSTLQADTEPMTIEGEESLFTFNDTIKKPLKHFGQFRQDEIKKVIEHVAIEKGYLVQQGNPKDRFFTNIQKYLLWKKQDGKSPASGKEIPLTEIYDHTKWQADHIIPWDQGGETTIDNGQLIESSINASFGNKIKSETIEVTA